MATSPAARLSEVAFKLVDLFAQIVLSSSSNEEAHYYLKLVQEHLESRIAQTGPANTLPPVGSPPESYGDDPL